MNTEAPKPVEGHSFDFSKSMPLSVDQLILATLERIEKLLLDRAVPTVISGPTTLEVKPSREQQIADLAKKTMGKRK